MKTAFDTIEGVIEDLRKGQIVIVVDDADRENEGDLILAAEHATAESVNFMAKFGRGLICVPTTADRLQQLGVERMVVQNRETFKTDFQVSVDAALELSACHRLGDRPNKYGVIHGLGIERANITHFVSEFLQQNFDLCLVIKPGVIRADGDFHGF